MSVPIPDHLKDLIERPIVAALVTVMPDGQPQATPVWFAYDGEHIIVNTARGRQKDRNMMARARVALSVIDPQDPYHWAELRGVVAEVDETSGRDWINRLSKRYRGIDVFKPNRPDEVRVTYKIAIERINGE